MRVLLAGASGTLGIPLTRGLIERGHHVLGLTRHPAGAQALSTIGATPIVADALDRDALLRALDGRAADAIVNELTALKKAPARHSGMALTNRLRIEGSANLLAAADLTGATRFVTQSIIFGYGYRDHGSTVLTEGDPFGEPAGTKTDPHVAAMRSAEEQALTAPEGIALRYGVLYGGDGGQLQALLARRRVPVANGGLLGWVHHHDAATATIAAIERGVAGEAYNVVDDQPASWREMITAMADAFDAPRPWAVPGWLMRLAAPYLASFAVDTSMRVSNEKAKRQLGWRPAFATYPHGVVAMASAARPDGARSASSLVNESKRGHA